jgi:hypothetical protein
MPTETEELRLQVTLDDQATEEGRRRRSQRRPPPGNTGAGPTVRPVTLPPGP